MANFSLLAKIGIDSKALQTGLASAEGRVGKFKAAVSAIGPAIAAIGFTSMAKKAIDTGSRISDLSEQLRINAESLQVLMAVAAKAGVQQSILEKALMSVTIRTQEALDGNKLYAESFERLGLNLETFANLGTDQKIVEIAKAYEKAGKSQEAYADIASILGTRAGPKMLEILRRINDEGFAALAKGARDAGQVMDKEVIDKMDAAADTIGIFQNAMTVATATVLGKAIPVFVIFKETCGHIGDAMVSLSGKIASFLTFVGSGLMSTLDPTIKSFEALGLAIKAAAQAASGDFSGAKKSIEEAKNAAISAGEELMNIPKEIVAAYETADAEMKAISQLIGLDTKDRNRKIKESYEDLFGIVKKTKKEIEEERATDVTANAEKEAAEAEKARKEEITKLEEEQKQKKLEALRAESKGMTALADQYNEQAAIQQETIDLMNRYNISQKEAKQLASDIAAVKKEEAAIEESKKKKEEDRLKEIEKLEAKINDMRLKALNAQANGEAKAAEAMEKRAEMAQKIVDLMNEYNISQEQATILANKTADAEAQKRSELEGHDLKKAANLAGKGKGDGGENIRFEKLASGGFQQFIGGRKGKKFSEAELQAGLQNQIDKDPTEALLEKINTTLEGKFVSQ